MKAGASGPGRGQLGDPVGQRRRLPPPGLVIGGNLVGGSAVGHRPATLLATFQKIEALHGRSERSEPDRLGRRRRLEQPEQATASTSISARLASSRATAWSTTNTGSSLSRSIRHVATTMPSCRTVPLIVRSSPPRRAPRLLRRGEPAAVGVGQQHVVVLGQDPHRGGEVADRRSRRRAGRTARGRVRRGRVRSVGRIALGDLADGLQPGPGGEVGVGGRTERRQVAAHDRPATSGMVSRPPSQRSASM